MLQNGSILETAQLALVRVAHDSFERSGRVADRLPFPACGKPGPAASGQDAIRQGLDDEFRPVLPS